MYILLRNARGSDYTAIGELARALASSAADRRSSFQAALVSADHDLIVAEADGVVVGFAHLLTYDDLTHGGLAGELLGLIVREDLRRKGIATALMSEIIRLARERSVRELHINTEPDNLAAQRFYAGLGARMVGVQMEVNLGAEGGAGSEAGASVVESAEENMSVHYAEMSWPDVKQAIEDDAIAVIPTGCIEQHGPHLPLDCDSGSPAAAVARACREHGMRALVLPVLPYGPAPEHMSFPGTISLGQETHVRVVREIVSSLLRHGFRRIVIVRGCGGHMGLEAAIRDLWPEERRKGRDVFIEVAPLFAASARVQEVVRKHFPDSQDVHAGEFETSICLATRPHLVAKERIPQTKSGAPERRSGWTRVEEISSDGATGEPSRATAEAGYDIVEAMERSVGEWLAEFDMRTRRRRG